MVNKRFKTVAMVIPDSIAEEAGIEPGDSLISVNGKRVRDIFDYMLLTMKKEIVIGVEKANGEIWEIEVQKDEDEDLGIKFEYPLADKERKCVNKCIFCFIDQLPSGMRDTLYFKDDDARLSFIHGNYITMTNMSDGDLERIIKYRLSPVNVSVHTTNPSLREFMLGNRNAGNVMHRIKKLVAAGITVNCQIVVCRGINDGEQLDSTLDDLAGLYPGVASISVVPVGLTRYREGRYPLQPIDSGSAKELIKQVENKQAECLQRHGSRIVFLADELYLKAGIDIPACHEYEDFPQLENGVGMLALFKNEFLEALNMNRQPGKKRVLPKEISIATGSAAKGFLEGLVQELCEYHEGLRINVYGIKNSFFGEHVTVSGLITGRDLINGLRGQSLGERLLIPRNMLKADELLFLDDYSTEKVEQELGVDVVPVEVSGHALVRSLAGDQPKERGE